MANPKTGTGESPRLTPLANMTPIDTVVGDVQPVGASASVGTLLTEAAPARHVHALGTLPNNSVGTSQLQSGSVGDAQLQDNSIKLRRLHLENGTTHITSVDSPISISPASTTWTNFGASVSISPAITSKLLIWFSVTTSIAASGDQIQLRLLFDGSPTTAVASAHSPGNGFYFCLSLLDEVASISGAGHTLQPQIWVGSGGFVMTFLSFGTQLRLMAIPSS